MDNIHEVQTYWKCAGWVFCFEIEPGQYTVLSAHPDLQSARLPAVRIACRMPEREVILIGLPGHAAIVMNGRCTRQELLDQAMRVRDEWLVVEGALTP